MSQDLIVGTHSQISTYLGIVPGRVTHWAREAAKAEGLVDVVIEDDEDAENVANLLKTMTASIKELDAERKRYTAPILELKASIDAGFTGSAAKLAAAKTAINATLTRFLQARQRAADAAKAKEVESQRRAAEALASAARSEGDEAGAQEIENIAEKLDGHAVISVRADTATASVRETVSGSVPGGETKREFLVWAAESLSVDDLEQIAVGQRLLNKIAKAAHDAGRKVPGLNISVTESARVA